MQPVQPQVVPVTTGAPWGVIGTAAGAMGVVMAAVGGGLLYKQVSELEASKRAMEETLKTALETFQDQSDAYALVTKLQAMVKRHGATLSAHERQLNEHTSTLEQLVGEVQELQQSVSSIQATLQSQLRGVAAPVRREPPSRRVQDMLDESALYYVPDVATERSGPPQRRQPAVASRSEEYASQADYGGDAPIRGLQGGYQPRPQPARYHPAPVSEELVPTRRTTATVKRPPASAAVGGEGGIHVHKAAAISSPIGTKMVGVSKIASAASSAPKMQPRRQPVAQSVSTPIIEDDEDEDEEEDADDGDDDDDIVGELAEEAMDEYGDEMDELLDQL